jgi:hypothetical protein
METIKSVIKCAHCKGTLEPPAVFLPCSNSVCQKHINNQEKEYVCLACDMTHSVPSGGGFPHNKALNTLLSENIDMLTFNQIYESAYKSFKNLENVMDELKLLRSDPSGFINKTIGELKRETNTVRDEYKLSIDRKADEILRELDKYAQDCQRNLDSSYVCDKLAKIGADIDGIQSELDKWSKTLRNFEPRHAEWKMIRENCDEYRNVLEMDLNEYEYEFLLKKLDDYQGKVVSFCKLQLLSSRK